MSNGIPTAAAQHIARAVIRRFLPARVREVIRSYRRLAVTVPESTHVPPCKRMAVVAPHMDDEVFGCGGTLALATKNGAHASVVYVTDGKKGYNPDRFPGEPPTDRTQREARLVERRKEEARCAGKILGLGEPVFLDLPDGELSVTRDAVAKLARALRDAEPEVLYLPSFFDIHPDHVTSTRLALEAAMSAGLPRSLWVWAYEVWTPLLANAVVDITDTAAQKDAAMAVFTSQTTDVDYPRVIRGLNTYRSLFTREGQGLAEASYVSELFTFQEMFNEIVSGTETR